MAAIRTFAGLKPGSTDWRREKLRNISAAPRTSTTHSATSIVTSDRLEALKIDCEGSEPAVIDGAGRFLENGSLKHIFMEYSPHFYKDRAAPERMFAELERYGFRCAEIASDGAARAMTRAQILALPDLVDLHLTRV